MANGTVRELVTKLTFKVDNSSLSRTNNAIRDLKQNLERLGGGLDSSLNNSLNRVRQNITRVSMSIRNLRRQMESLRNIQTRDFSANQNPNGRDFSNNRGGNVGTMTVRTGSTHIQTGGLRINSSSVRVSGGNVTVTGFNPHTQTPPTNSTTGILNAIRNIRVMHADRVFVKGNISGGNNHSDGGDNPPPNPHDRTPPSGGGGRLRNFVDQSGNMLAAEFESTMSKVKAITTTGMGTEEANAAMRELTAQARLLGATTQFSATQAGEAMTYLGMAGWKTKQIIGCMPGLLNLAAAGGVDLATTADIVSDGMTAMGLTAGKEIPNQFGKMVDSTTHFADVMAAASSNANTNVQMMGETFKYAAAPAGALGYSIDDLALATGLMANAGIKSSMAGTALRSIFTRMSTETDKAGQAMNMLGIKMTDDNGKMKSFTTVIKEMRGAFQKVDPSQLTAAVEQISGSKMKNKDKIIGMLEQMKVAGGVMSEADKIKFANMLAGQEAMSGLLSLVMGSDEDFQKLETAIANADGTAENMAQTMNDNAQGALKELNSALESVAIDIGNALLPAISEIIKAITPVVSAISQFAQENPKLTATIVSVVSAIGALLVTLGGIGLAVGGIMGLAPVFSAIGGAVTGLGGIFTSVFGAVVRFFSGGFTGIILRVLSLLSSIGGTISGAFATLMSGGLTGLISSIGTALGGVATAAAPVAAGIAIIGSVIYYVYQHWDELKNYFMSSMPEINAAVDKLKYAWESIQPAIQALLPLLGIIANFIGVIIVGAIKILWEIGVAAFGALAEAVNTVVWAINGIIGGIQKAIGWFQELIGMSGQAGSAAANASAASLSKVNNSYSQTNNVNVGSVGEATSFVNNATDFYAFK